MGIRICGGGQSAFGAGSWEHGAALWGWAPWREVRGSVEGQAPCGDLKAVGHPGCPLTGPGGNAHCGAWGGAAEGAPGGPQRCPAQAYFSAFFSGLRKGSSWFGKRVLSWNPVFCEAQQTHWRGGFLLAAHLRVPPWVWAGSGARTTLGSEATQQGTEYGGSHSHNASEKRSGGQPNGGGTKDALPPCPWGPTLPAPGPPQTQERPSLGAVPPRHALCPEGGRSLPSYVDPMVVAGFSWHSEDRTRCVAFRTTPPAWPGCWAGLTVHLRVCAGLRRLRGFWPWLVAPPVWGSGTWWWLDHRSAWQGHRAAAMSQSQLLAQLLSSVFVQPDILL